MHYVISFIDGFKECCTYWLARLSCQYQYSIEWPHNRFIPPIRTATKKKKKEHSLLFVNQPNERTSGVVHDNATNDNSIGRSVFWVEQCKIDHSMRYTHRLTGPSLRLSLQNWLWIDKRNHSGGVFPDFRTLPKSFYVTWKKAFGIRPHTSTHTQSFPVVWRRYTD